MALITDFVDSFKLGQMNREEIKIGMIMGTVGLITTVALAILGAPPLTLGLFGLPSALILTGALLGSRGITVSGFIASVSLFIAGTMTGKVPVRFMVSL